MKVNELSKILHFYSEHGHEDDIVLITLSQPSVGARASVGVQGVFSGFDWEDGQIRIEPVTPLIAKYNNRDIGKPARCTEYGEDDGYIRKRIVRHCPICDEFLRKNDKYCSNCGQAIDWEQTK